MNKATVTVVRIDQIKIPIHLAFWHCTHRVEFLLNIKVFVDVAAQVKLVT